MIPWLLSSCQADFLQTGHGPDRSTKSEAGSKRAKAFSSQVGVGTTLLDTTRPWLHAARYGDLLKSAPALKHSLYCALSHHRTLDPLNGRMSGSNSSITPNTSPVSMSLRYTRLRYVSAMFTPKFLPTTVNEVEVPASSSGGFTL
eukprot:1177793-Rhodomonas_salina.1